MLQFGRRRCASKLILRRNDLMQRRRIQSIARRAEQGCVDRAINFFRQKVNTAVRKRHVDSTSMTAGRERRLSFRQHKARVDFPLARVRTKIVNRTCLAHIGFADFGTVKDRRFMSVRCRPGFFDRGGIRPVRMFSISMSVLENPSVTESCV